MAKKSREIYFFQGKSGVLNKVLHGEALHNKNHNVSSTFSQALNASVSPFEPFYPRIWQISLPFYIPQLVKSLPFTWSLKKVPRSAWASSYSQAINVPLIVSNSPPPRTKLQFPELPLNIIIIINLYFGLNWAHVIAGFHMTSLKFKLKNCRFYRDFTFTMH